MASSNVACREDRFWSVPLPMCEFASISILLIPENLLFTISFHAASRAGLGGPLKGFLSSKAPWNLIVSYSTAPIAGAFVIYQHEFPSAEGWAPVEHLQYADSWAAHSLSVGALRTSPEKKKATEEIKRSISSIQMYRRDRLGDLLFQGSPLSSRRGSASLSYWEGISDEFFEIGNSLESLAITVVSQYLRKICLW